ncbi:MAG: VOC family protein [bacterium]
MNASNPFTGVDHQIFVVADMEAAVMFWQNQLGLALRHRTVIESHHVDQAFFPLPDGTFIELLAPTDASSPVAKIIEKNGEGLHVLALKVADLAGAIQVLKTNGAVLTGEGTDRVFVHPEQPGTPMIQLWPESRPHRWRDDATGHREVK